MPTIVVYDYLNNINTFIFYSTEYCRVTLSLNEPNAVPMKKQVTMWANADSLGREGKNTYG
jgi:hypothetical protein